jgi:hypothetical protein
VAETPNNEENLLTRKFKTLVAASAVVAAIGATAAPAGATTTWQGGYCSAVESNDGHTLYPATCSTAAPRTQWFMVVTTCGTSSCRDVPTPVYRQGDTARFTTGGYITNVRYGYY